MKRMTFILGVFFGCLLMVIFTKTQRAMFGQIAGPEILQTNRISYSNSDYSDPCTLKAESIVLFLGSTPISISALLNESKQRLDAMDGYGVRVGCPIVIMSTEKNDSPVLFSYGISSNGVRLQRDIRFSSQGKLVSDKVGRVMH